MRQSILNLNFPKTKALQPGSIEYMVQEKKAMLNSAVLPIPSNLEVMLARLKLSQYRENVHDFVDGMSTFLAYPVFDSFQEDSREVVGVLASNIYWKILFTSQIPSLSHPVTCVVTNSYNQTFAYKVDSQQAAFIGTGDPHDSEYDKLSLSADITEYLRMRASPQTRAYATVPLSGDTKYTLTVYPSDEMEAQYITSTPIVYTVIAICCFGFVSILFLAFSHVVERRQEMMIMKVSENARKAATAEREVNEFLSHEVRNPLSAALSACSFVSAALHEPDPLSNPETRRLVREDIEVVNASINSINDFLRSMLDIHRTVGNHIKIEKSPTNLLKDVFEPVSAILYKRGLRFSVIVDCPDNLSVLTDPIRLKQVLLNLVRNSSKFVEQGFIRMGAAVVDKHQVQVYVEDSGPGISVANQTALFSKYHDSLDLLNQGTGLGLNLSQKLTQTMGGELFLDCAYKSGIEGCPGARFVVKLNAPPLNIELPTMAVCASSPSMGTPADSKCSDIDLERSSVPITVQCLPSQEMATVEQKAIPATSPNQPELPSSLRVLFVDDDSVLRKLFVRALTKAQPNWTILEASSGEAALELCEEEEHIPDLIFMDQYMTTVDRQLLGTETVEAMRSKGMECIICGLSANDIRDRFLEVGADDFVLKPIPCKVDDLRALLRKILGTRPELKQMSV